MSYEEAQQAVHVAREYVKQMFADEALDDVLLEEIRPNEDEGGWYVTIGFSRAWDPMPANWSNSVRLKRRPRSYKLVHVSSEGAALWLMERELAELP